jgi:hypothetical protein
MTYYESAKGARITKQRALQELRRHGFAPEQEAEFLAEMGDRENYNAQSVLAWLGY